MLIHTTWATDRFNVVTGIGLNVTNRRPTTCVEVMLREALIASGVTESCKPSLEGATDDVSTVEEPALLGRELLLACILNQLEQLFKVWETEQYINIALESSMIAPLFL